MTRNPQITPCLAFDGQAQAGASPASSPSPQQRSGGASGAAGAAAR